MDAPASRSSRLRVWRRVLPRASPAGCAVLLFVLCVSLASFLLSPGGSSFATRFLTSVNFPFLLPALDNVLVGALVVSRLFPQRREGPWRLRMIALDLAFAASVRMIHGIHGHAANGWLFPVPPRAPGFSIRFVFMVEVANLDHENETYGKAGRDRKNTRLNSSHQIISYAVFCLKKK